MKYVFLKNGVVVDRFQIHPSKVVIPEYAAQFIEAPDEVDHQWTYDGVTFSPPAPAPEVVTPPAPTKEELLAELQTLTAKINAL
jgi:hypothetical protein